MAWAQVGSTNQHQIVLLPTKATSYPDGHVPFNISTISLLPRAAAYETDEKVNQLRGKPLQDFFCIMFGMSIQWIKNTATFGHGFVSSGLEPIPTLCLNDFAIPLNARPAPGRSTPVA